VLYFNPFASCGWETFGVVAQSVRALPCHGRGREFESRQPRFTQRSSDDAIGLIDVALEFRADGAAVAHLVYTEVAGGSNPSPPTRLQSRCRSLLRLRTWQYIFAALAQLVEQRTENPRVTGSSPVCGILFPSFLELPESGRHPANERSNL
jgi:hypothetical protein